MLGALPGDRREDFTEIWGEELLSLEKENASDFERQNAIGNTTNTAQAVDEVDATHARLLPLREA